MRCLSIKRELSSNTKIRDIPVWVGTGADSYPDVLSLHITDDDEVILTDGDDYTKVYAIMSLDYYNKVELTQE